MSTISNDEILKRVNSKTQEERRELRLKHQCSKKIRYTNSNLAQERLNTMKLKPDRYTALNIKLLRPYECQVCYGWHIGKRKRYVE
jgi:hypothetical protein